MIAVFYHCKLSGEAIPSWDGAVEILREQMAALEQSGLADAAAEIHIGINGGQADAFTVAKYAPNKGMIHTHGTSARSELPTFAVLRRWLPAHSNWAVCYHHIKGVTQPDSDEKKNHR